MNARTERQRQGEPTERPLDSEGVPRLGSDASAPTRESRAFMRADNFRLVLVWGIAWGVVAWLFDQLGSNVSAATPDALEDFRIRLCQLFTSVLVGALAGAVAGLWFAASLGGKSADEARVELSARNSAPPAEQAERAARFYASLSLVFGACAALFWWSPELVVGVARPRNVAWALVASLLLIVLVALLSFPLVLRLWRLVARRLAGTEGGRWLFKSSLRSLLPLGVLLLALVALVFRELAPLVTALGYREPLKALVALLVALGGVILLRRAPAWLSTALAAAVFTACAGGAVVGFTLKTSSGSTRAALLESTTLSAPGVALLRVFLDADGDGHIEGFADRDCAPHDERIHPGALDIADNGVDENCDGHDLVRSSLFSKPGRHDHELPEAWPRHPNLYLVTIDAFAPMALAAFGSHGKYVPFIDSLVERAALFDNYFVQGPSTRLSLPSMFTSRFDSQIARVVRGRHPFEIAPSNRTLAEVLGKSGYQTLAVLPNRYFMPANWPGITQGFAIVDDSPARTRGPRGEHTARKVTDRALELMTRAEASPKFLWVHYFDAHPPHSSPDGTPTADERSAYLAELAYVDTELGRLLGELRERDPNGVFVVTGDHAIAFDDPRHERSHYAYDLSTVVLRVPLLVSAPFIARGRHEALVSSLDLAPTLANLAQVKGPLPFLGHSLVPALAGGESERPGRIFSQFYIPEDRLVGRDPLRLVGVRDATFNVVLDRRSGLVEAWDYRNDPFETRDVWLSANIETRRRLDDMKRTLDDFVNVTHRARPAARSAH